MSIESNLNPERIRRVGFAIIQYGLVVVIAWIGAMKFTSVEAEAIKPLVENSPLMSWLYGPLSVQGFSNALGVFELLIAAMIASRVFAPRVAAVGCVLGIGMFLTTLTFILSTPGWEPSIGAPALSVVPGQFILKDIVLLGACVLILGESLADVKR